jgi:DNA repair exonuclease SbcCD ATPase subunit
MIDNNSPAPPRETEDDGNNAEAVRHELRRVERWLRQVQAQLDDARRARDCAKAALAEIAAALAASEDARRKAEELKDSYKAERDEYAKSATALRAQLATVTAERDALHGKLLVANAGWDSSQNSLVLAQTARARAEAALATVREAVRAIVDDWDRRWFDGGDRPSSPPAAVVNARLTLIELLDAALAAAPRAGETTEGT